MCVENLVIFECLFLCDIKISKIAGTPEQAKYHFSGGPTILSFKKDFAHVFFWFWIDDQSHHIIIITVIKYIKMGSKTVSKHDSNQNMCVLCNLTSSCTHL